MYALLEAECLRAFNIAGLDAHVGFLHEMNPGFHCLSVLSYSGKMKQFSG
ncbi:CRISPR-associated endonuclease Cas1 [Methanolobus sp. WCC4]